MNGVYDLVRVVGPLRDALTGIAAYGDSIYIGTADGTLTVYKRGGACTMTCRHHATVGQWVVPPPAPDWCRGLWLSCVAVWHNVHGRSRGCAER